MTDPKPDESDPKWTDALRELLAKRQAGTFVSLDEGERRTQDMIARKKAEHGL